MESIGLYIHIPFCENKCHYCDFLSFPHQEGRMEGYMQNIYREIELYERSYDLVADTVYIGGGTPSFVPVVSIEELMKRIRRAFQLTEGAEITMEANPGTLTRESLDRYRETGINRLSLGIQSMNDEVLRSLGRNYSVSRIYEDLEDIRGAGFENLSVDMMMALPGQRPDDLIRDVKAVTDLSPEHISYYDLILEEKTYFYWLHDQGRLELPDEDEEIEMNHVCTQMLEKEGYRRYEVSNYAREGYESIHNAKYWRLRPYLGLGMGSHSHLFGERFYNARTFSGYEGALAQGDFSVAARNVVGRFEEMEEFVIMGMRMTQGISEDEFRRRYGISLDEHFGSFFEEEEKKGWIVRENGRIYFTSMGMDLSNPFYVRLLSVRDEER